MTALIIINLSAAFDVIDYPILLKRLEFFFGIKEKALSWVKSNLTYRTQCVSVGNKASPDLGLLLGVPQWSVLGPNNYWVYTKQIGEIIKPFNIKYHCYAYDTQVYMTLKSRGTWDDISSSIKICIADTSTWMNRKMLKLNKDKR